MRTLAITIVALLSVISAIAHTTTTTTSRQQIPAFEFVEGLQLRADQGDAEAQYFLGFMYDRPDQDYAAAAGWYRKAVDQGYADAQYCLGHTYENGRGVPQDFVSAA